ncbi:MAG: alanine racemase [Desulfovibrionaceae bacterium]
MFSLCHCHIDHPALTHNLHQMGDLSTLMPIIKSNAYGHGMLSVAHTLSLHGTQHFAVGTVDEGLALRQAGMRQNIVILLGAPTAEAMSACAAHSLIPLVHSFDSLHRAAAQGSVQQPLRIAIKQESGMARLGFRLDELPPLLEALRALPQVAPCLLLSHLACADMPEKHASVMAQAHAFGSMFALLRESYPHIKACLNNSAGILGFPQLAYALSRPGIALYGYNPFAGTPLEASGPVLRPVMSVSSRILQVRALPAHTPVSYGESYVTPTATRVAVLGVGYADGFSRGLSNKGRVVIAGQRVPIIGRVCMGMCMADVGALPANTVREGDWAWLLGGPDPAALSAQDIAADWGTIPYEVLCLLGANTHVDEGFTLDSPRAFPV